MNPDLARALARALAMFGVAVRVFLATSFRIIEVVAGLLARALFAR